MRVGFSIIFIIVGIALIICAVVARRSQKPIGKPLSIMLISLLPPIAGNTLIIFTGSKFIATIGCYVYFMGMDYVMGSLIGFTFAYCNITWPRRWIRTLVYLALFVDLVQFALNPFFGHAFRTTPVIVDGYAYYKLLPLAGQTYHRMLDYLIFFGMLLIFIFMLKKTPRIYAGRYGVILAAMLIVGGWQTFYIFSQSPVDRSMIGYGIFGLLIFYFSLLFRPYRALDNMLSEVVQEMEDAVFLFDDSDTCIWANDRGVALTGIGGMEFESAGSCLAEIFGPPQKKGSCNAERTVGIGENARYYTITRQVVKQSGSFLIVHDSTEEKLEVRKKIYNSTHDKLTGLFTREYLYERIRSQLDEEPEVGREIVYIDVDSFKLVNDIFGTEFGDHVLQEIADWIREEFTEFGGVFGRLSSDKFGLCLPKGVLDEQRIQDRLSHFEVSRDMARHILQIHLGVYEITDPSMDVSVMFDRANMAHNTIKNNLHVHIARYNEEIRREALWERDISNDVPKAIEEKQLCPYLQPLVDRSGKIVGAEALVRWNHPVHGFLPPIRFIPALEKNGLIANVDRYMWRCVCEILSRWDNDLFISVNISPKDFYFMDVAAEIRSLVKEFDIDPRKLRLEITETVMMADVENRMQILNELREDGFIIEMDDFGSGYSSLNLLKDMPVDVLKIDMAFLRESREKERTQTIMHSIIRMSEELGMASLTEGVETEDQFIFLQKMGCTMFQGYYFAKPLPVPEFEEKWVA